LAVGVVELVSSVELPVELPVEFEVWLLAELPVELLKVVAPPATVELEAGSDGETVSFSGNVTILWPPPLCFIAWAIICEIDVAFGVAVELEEVDAFATGVDAFEEEPEVVLALESVPLLIEFVALPEVLTLSVEFESFVEFDIPLLLLVGSSVSLVAGIT